MKKKEQKQWKQMNKTKWISLGVGLTLFVLGIVLTVVTRTNALAEEAGTGAKIPFALGLIMILVGIAISALLTVRSISPWVWRKLLSIWVMCSACWQPCSWAACGAAWLVRWV